MATYAIKSSVRPFKCVDAKLSFTSFYVHFSYLVVLHVSLCSFVVLPTASLLPIYTYILDVPGRVVPELLYGLERTNCLHT
jgi:hypothetical protein